MFFYATSTNFYGHPERKLVNFELRGTKSRGGGGPADSGQKSYLTLRILISDYNCLKLSLALECLVHSMLNKQEQFSAS